MYLFACLQCQDVDGRLFHILFLMQMAINNLQYLNSILTCKRPLFSVETLLSTPEIVLHPPVNELFKITVQTMRGLVEG